jgi:hypothetical protein
LIIGKIYVLSYGGIMEKPFFSALFDSSFTNFIARRVAKVIYIIVMVLTGIGVVLGVLGGLALMSQDLGAGLLVLIVSPLVGLLFLIVVRLAFESTVALVVIAENTSKDKSSK